MRCWRPMICATLLGGVVASPPEAAESRRQTLLRDRSLERALRFESGADKMITPRRVFKALFSDEPVEQIPDYYTDMEFLPLVDANQDQVRAVAAIAYKF